LEFSVRELAEKVGAEFRGDGAVVIHTAAPIETAGAGQITFISNPAYKKFVATTKASALVVSPNIEVTHCASIVGKNPYLLFSRIIDILYPPIYNLTPGVHPSAVAAPTATISDNAQINANVTIEDDVTIGSGTIVNAGTFIGKGVTLGENCLINPNVSILHGTKIGNNVAIYSGTVIGSDGFGFAPTEPGKEYQKIRQVGWVEIHDNVEIGANVTIDRGAIGPTVIERGVKIDNLVMIAHNVRVGENTIIVAQVGISGSTRVGKNCILAGQVGVVGHIEIGDGAIVGAQSGVGKSLDGGGVYFGSPAKPMMESRRIEAVIRNLPDLQKRIKALETKFATDDE